MFIRFNVATKRVVYTGNAKPLNVENGEFETIEYSAAFPNKYDWLIYENGTLIPCFYEYTKEELEAQKQKRYSKLVEQYIREKYSLSNELAILRQRDTKPEEFNEYNVYAETCKTRAKEELKKAEVNNGTDFDD